MSKQDAEEDSDSAVSKEVEAPARRAVKRRVPKRRSKGGKARRPKRRRKKKPALREIEELPSPVSYTHLTLPTKA